MSVNCGPASDFGAQSASDWPRSLLRRPASRRSRHLLHIALALLALLLAITGVAEQTADGRIMIGVYAGSSFPSDIDRYTAAVGASPSIVMWFQSWDEPLYYDSQMIGIAERGSRPLITWSPGEDFDMADLLRGRYDSYILEQAARARDWGHPLMIRLFHEMNGTWQSFGPTRTSPADFIRGWRHVVDLFRSEGATNVSWVWTPNVVGFGGSSAIKPLYPGDGYVDWVGIDGFNPGRPWRDWRELFAPSYRTITAMTSKPFMIAEWGSAEIGGDKAEWISDFFDHLPSVMPKVDAVVAFSRVAERDFRIDSSPAALAAYRAALHEHKAYAASGS